MIDLRNDVFQTIVVLLCGVCNVLLLTVMTVQVLLWKRQNKVATKAVEEIGETVDELLLKARYEMEQMNNALATDLKTELHAAVNTLRTATKEAVSVLNQTVTEVSQRCVADATREATETAHETAQREWDAVVRKITYACEQATTAATEAATRANNSVKIVFNTVENAGEIAEKSVENANSALEITRNVQLQTEEALKRMEESHFSESALLGRMELLCDGNGQRLARFEQRVNVLNVSVTHSSEKLDRLRGIESDIEDAIVRLAAIVDSSKNMRSLIAATNDLKHSGEMVATDINSVIQSLEYSGDNVSKETKRAAERLQSSEKRAVAAVSELNTAADYMYNKIEATTRTVSQIQSTAQSLGQSSENLEKSVSRLSTLKALTEEFKGTIESLERLLEKAQRVSQNFHAGH